MNIETNYAELQRAADYGSVRSNLAGVGIGSMVFGALAVFIGWTNVKVHPMNLWLAILGVMLIVEGIWLTAKQSRAGLLIDGVALVVLSFWNFAATIVNGSHTGQVNNFWAILAACQFLWGIQSIRRYRRFSNVSSSSEEPPLELKEWVEQAAKDVKQAVIDDDDVIAIMGRPRAFALPIQWKGRLHGDGAVFVMTSGGDDILILPKDQVILNARREPKSRTVKHRAKITLHLGERRIKGTIPGNHLDHFETWQNQPQQAESMPQNEGTNELADLHESNREELDRPSAEFVCRVPVPDGQEGDRKMCRFRKKLLTFKTQAVLENEALLMVHLAGDGSREEMLNVPLRDIDSYRHQPVFRRARVKGAFLGGSAITLVPTLVIAIIIFFEQIGKGTKPDEALLAISATMLLLCVLGGLVGAALALITKDQSEFELYDRQGNFVVAFRVPLTEHESLVGTLEDQDWQPQDVPTPPVSLKDISPRSTRRIMVPLGAAAGIVVCGIALWWHFGPRPEYGELPSPVRVNDPEKGMPYSNDDPEAPLFEATDHETVAKGKMVRRLRGHAKGVRSVAFSPDGTRVLTSSWDKSAIVWDVNTGTEIRVFTMRDGAGQSAFGSDGTQVLMGTSNSNTAASMFDIETGKKTREFDYSGGGTLDVGFNPGCTRVLANYFEETIVWDANNGELLHEFNKESAFSYVLSPDGNRVLHNETEATILWDLNTGRTICSFDSAYASYAFNSDGTKIVMGDKKGARLWDVSQEREICRFDGHSEPVTAVAFSRDGARVVTGSGKSVLLWNAKTGKSLLRFDGHKDTVISAAFSPKGDLILTGSDDKTAIMWDAGPADGASEK